MNIPDFDFFDMMASLRYQTNVTIKTTSGLSYTGIIRGVQAEDASGKNYNVTMLTNKNLTEIFFVRFP